MVRPCVARSFVDLVFGLASMYPASDWSGSLLRANMDISARSISLPDRPRQGHLGHQCSIAPGRPVSISSLPLADLGGEDVACITPTSSAAPHLVSSLVRADRRSFIPACSLDMRRAQARSRPARSAARVRLDGAEHGASITQVGSNHRLSSLLRILVPWRALPRRYARACWRVRSPARCGAAASWRPRSTT
jgi:hypothetical protein